MNPKASALLAEPHPCGHIVYPYTDRDLLAQAVCLYASAGLRKDEAVILIMRRDNCPAITGGLCRQGFDLQDLQRTGQLNCMLAEDTLPRFMVDGMPDVKKLEALAEGWIGTARARMRNGSKVSPIRAFGEMVCLLWGNNLRAAARLEQLWGNLIEAHSFSLLCSYQLTGPAPKTLASELGACHAHNLA